MALTGSQLTTEQFLEMKWRKFFKVLDVDHDRKVTREDHMLMGQRFAAASDVPEERKAVIRQQFVKIWDTFLNAEGAESEMDEQAFIDLHHHQGVDRIREIGTHISPVMFRAIDSDGDGFIQVEEFHNFFRLFTKDDSQAKKSFEIIDLNKDGKLSEGEFTEAFVEFTSGVDQKSPYKFFFGTLNE